MGHTESSNSNVAEKINWIRKDDCARYAEVFGQRIKCTDNMEKTRNILEENKITKSAHSYLDVLRRQVLWVN